MGGPECLLWGFVRDPNKTTEGQAPLLFCRSINLHCFWKEFFKSGRSFSTGGMRGKNTGLVALRLFGSTLPQIDSRLRIVTSVRHIHEIGRATSELQSHVNLVCRL